MRVLSICAEYAPLAKVGGLADVTAGLSAWLAGRAHDVIVVMPRYASLRDAAVMPEPAASFPVGPRSCTVHRLAGSRAGGPAVYVVDAPEFHADGIYPAGDAEALRFLLLSRAALQFAAATGFEPHIVHCHDWHTAPAAALLADAQHCPAVFRESYTVLTVHNIGYQGVFDAQLLERAGAPELRPLFEVAAPGNKINFLRAGIVHADAITTVSPTHAREIQTPEYGMGLEGLLRQRRHRLVGILNGVDYSHWNPETDALLPATYAADDLTGKRLTRTTLLDELGLDAAPDAPVAGMVARLTQQKGMDIVIHALPELLRRHPLVCAFLGTGERRYASGLADLARRFPGRVAHVDAHDEVLAHRIFGGSDLLLVPSLYEPCGLTQMYAMRYGSVPVVRRTGGLADTVRHFDPTTGEGTGSVFRDADVGGLTWGIEAALRWYSDPPSWARLVRNAMAEDFSWNRQGPHYEALFSRLASAA